MESTCPSAEDFDEICQHMNRHITYNILHGFVDIDAGSLFDTINCNVIRSRGHILRIIKQHCNVNCRSSSFVYRNVNAWNSLPEQASKQASNFIRQNNEKIQIYC